MTRVSIGAGSGDLMAVDVVVCDVWCLSAAGVIIPASATRVWCVSVCECCVTAVMNSSVFVSSDCLCARVCLCMCMV